MSDRRIVHARVARHTGETVREINRIGFQEIEVSPRLPDAAMNCFQKTNGPITMATIVRAVMARRRAVVSV